MCAVDPCIVRAQTADGKTKKLNSAIRIKGVDIVGKNIIVWSGKKAEVHPASLARTISLFAFFGPKTHQLTYRSYSTRYFLLETNRLFL